MRYFKISIGIFIALSASRLVPHPPNFTSLLALSFYVPALLGVRYIPALMISFVITDLVLGIHNSILFTWGSVLVIGLMSNYLKKSIISRTVGALLGALLFYIITNFGVWSGGSYGYSYEGLINCYILALPFFAYSLISTLIFSTTIESVRKFYIIKKFENKKNLL
jgi:hypothetical protein